MEQGQSAGMSEPGGLRLMVSEGQCVVTFGRRVFYPCGEADTGMRNRAAEAGCLRIACGKVFNL